MYEHLDCFCYFAITHNATMNNFVYMYSCMVALALRYIPRTGSADFKGKCICRLLGVANFPCNTVLICIPISNL